VRRVCDREDVSYEAMSECDREDVSYEAMSVCDREDVSYEAMSECDREDVSYEAMSECDREDVSYEAMSECDREDVWLFVCAGGLAASPFYDQFRATRTAAGNSRNPRQPDDVSTPLLYLLNYCSSLGTQVPSIVRTLRTLYEIK